jgi:hypothetical protein
MMTPLRPVSLTCLLLAIGMCVYSVASAEEAKSGNDVIAQDNTGKADSIFGAPDKKADDIFGAPDKKQDGGGLFDDGPAEADVTRGETVLTRARPETDPLGIRMESMDGFLFFPKITYEQTYTDNTYSTESDTNKDFIFMAKPEVRISSDWSNHSLNLAADTSIGRYDNDDKAENYEDYHGSVDGTFDITREIFAFGVLDYSKLHEGRGSPDDVNGKNPTEYTLGSGALQYFHSLNRLSFTVDAGQDYYNYDDAPTSTTPTNNDDRDRVHSNLSVRAGYEIIPEYEAYVRIGGNNIDYDDALDDNGFNRDSKGFEAVTGVYMDLGGIAFGDAFLGYRQQKYTDTNLTNVSAMTYGTAMDWNITELTTLNGTISRTLEETTSGSISAFLSTSLTVSADHELLRNLLLNANLSVTQAAYKGGTTQEDYTYAGGFGTNYMMNRNLYVSGDYTYTQKESDVAGGTTEEDYTNNMFIVRISTQM